MKFGWTILYVEDVLKAVEFYEKCFGLVRRFVHESGTYAEMETGQTALAFADYDTASESIADYRRNSVDETPPGLEIAFISEDVPAAYKKALENGATELMAPTQKPWGQTVAYVRDLNGFIVEIGSPTA